MNSPSGTANNAVAAANRMMRDNSSAARRLRVTPIAQAGAIAGLSDVEHQQKTKAITDVGRALFEKTFAQMGLKYTPSSANFVLVHVGDGGEVFKRLMKKGIIVRSMVSYRLPQYIRVSVGTPEQNARFLAELPEALEGLVAFTKPSAVILPPANFPPRDAERPQAEVQPSALAETQVISPLVPAKPAPFSS